MPRERSGPYNLGRSPFGSAGSLASRSAFARSRGFPAPDMDARLIEQALKLHVIKYPGESAPAPELALENVQAARFIQPPAAPVREELRYGNPLNIPLSIGLASTRVLLAPPPNTRRVFLFIVNTHAVQILFLQFGQDATALQIPINPGNGAIGFDAFVPQSDIYLIANGAATTGVLSYANKGVNDYPELPAGG